MGPALAGMRVPGGSIGFAGGKCRCRSTEKANDRSQEAPRGRPARPQRGQRQGSENNGVPRDGMHSAPPMPDEPREEVAVPDPEYQPTANASLAAVRGALRAAWQAVESPVRRFLGGGP